MITAKGTKYFVYGIYNTINGKLYIGITSNCTRRWTHHKWVANHHHLKYALHWALKKHGASFFIFKKIEEFASKEAACLAEIAWIKSLKENKYKLYNETDGGEGSLGVRRYGSDNPNYGKGMRQHVKDALRNAQSPFTTEKVAELKRMYSSGNYTQTQLAKLHNASLTCIHKIVRGKHWNDGEKPKITPRLKAEQVLEIRSLYAEEGYTALELSQKFNLSVRHIFKIINREKWKNI